MIRIVKGIRGLKPLSKKGKYDYTPEHVAFIVQTLENEKKVIQEAFASAMAGKQTTETAFKFALGGKK